MSDDPRTYAGWVSAFKCSTDFEADMVRDRLDEAGIAAVVLTQRDHSFNLNVGDLSPVHVMVPPDAADAARALLGEAQISDADLEAAAMSADVMAPDAHTPEHEAMLDSGLDSLSLAVPDDANDASPAEETPPQAETEGVPLVGHHTFATPPADDAPADDAGDDAADDAAAAYDPTRPEA